jgi:hypothetical protein
LLIRYAGEEAPRWDATSYYWILLVLGFGFGGHVIVLGWVVDVADPAISFLSRHIFFLLSVSCFPAINIFGTYLRISVSFFPPKTLPRTGGPPPTMHHASRIASNTSHLTHPSTMIDHMQQSATNQSSSMQYCSSVMQLASGLG